MADHQVSRLVGVVLGATLGVITLVACGGREGTVLEKVHQGVDERECRASAIVTAPVSVPVSGVCAVPECWRLVVRDSDGDTFEACVSPEEYDRSRPGGFWHERTDR